MLEYTWIAYHVALRLNHNIVVIGGINKMSDLVPTNEIYMYNLYTEQWKKHEIQGNKPALHYKACAAVIGTAIYMFGGRDIETHELFTDLWKFTRIAQGGFSWCKIEFQRDVKLPSPRYNHSAWEYEECMWVFGGSVDTENYSKYLNYHGAFQDKTANQLLCYDPATQLWTNHPSSGAVPSPRRCHGTALIGDKVWLLGGCSMLSRDWIFNQDHCFYELDMKLFAWTGIPTKETIPYPDFGCSLVTISDAQLLLHLGVSEWDNERSDTWLIDISSKTWRQYTSIQDQFRCGQTSTVSVNRCAIIIGGLEESEKSGQTVKVLSHVMLEPKSLKQLAMKTIYNERDELRWMCLPPKLIDQLDLFQ